MATLHKNLSGVVLPIALVFRKAERRWKNKHAGYAAEHIFKIIISLVEVRLANPTGATQPLRFRTYLPDPLWPNQISKGGYVV
jgi:hypothetical protein